VNHSVHYTPAESRCLLERLRPRRYPTELDRARHVIAVVEVAPRTGSLRRYRSSHSQ
jgi:hypothetical protein